MQQRVEVAVAQLFVDQLAQAVLRQADAVRQALQRQPFLLTDPLIFQKRHQSCQCRTRIRISVGGGPPRRRGRLRWLKVEIAADVAVRELKEDEGQDRQIGRHERHMGDVVGWAVRIDQHPRQEAGHHGDDAADRQGEGADAPPALDHVEPPVGDGPIEGEGGEQRLQKSGRGLGGEAGVAPSGGDQRASRLFKAELDDQQEQQPPGEAPPVREQGETQQHEEARRQIAGEIQEASPAADVDPECRRHPIAVLLMAEHDAAGHAERYQTDELSASQPWPAGQHPHAQQSRADDRRHIDRKEDERRTQAAFSLLRIRARGAPR